MITPPLMFDPASLQATVEEVAVQVAQPGIPARTIGAIAISARPGITVDIAATTQAVLAALLETNAPLVSVPVVVTLADPPSDDVLMVKVETSLSRPLLLRSPEYGFDLALDPVKLDQIITGHAPLQLDLERLRAYLADMASQIDLPPQDARLRFEPAMGGPVVLQPSRLGRSLDIEATMQSVQVALAGGSDGANLAIVEVAPAVDSTRIAEMGIHELVASGATYFAGSSASRIHNIEVGAEKFAGIVIPPDGIFSFNEIVRDVSSANGFEDSLIIWGDRTAVGVGGGVCQVSTTVFRAAYEGGFPIVERYNHGYVVDWYGEPGLDATIYTPTVDFRFRNDTDAFLLIDPVVDSLNGVITFNFYGTRPARTVTVSEPQITQALQPEPATYVVDESLAAGEQQQVEWQKEGMTVTVTRTIVEHGVERTDTLVSHYLPWRAVYLVGPGTDLSALAMSAP